MAQVGIWNRVCGVAMEVVRSLLEKSVVAAAANGRNNQISADGSETDEQGFLWCWMPTPWSRMPCATGEQDPDTLWLQDKHGTQNERVTGATDSGIGGVSAAAARILQKVQRLGNVDVVGLSVGEV